MRELEIQALALLEARQQIKDLICELAEAKARLATQEALLCAHQARYPSSQENAENNESTSRISKEQPEGSKRSAPAYQNLPLAAELEAANKELEAFCYSVSHDLRAPLRSINGFSKALMEDFGNNLEPEALRYLKNIERSSVQMGMLIDDLLQFSRMSRMQRCDAVCDMDAMVQSTWLEIAEQDSQRKIVFSKMRLPGITADRSMMRQVWLNLLSNSAKFSRNCVVARIHVEAEILNDEVVFSVEDNGAGFDMRYADKLFAPFQRLHKARDFEGTGVGLALVQRIVRKHGGRIWAASKVNEGATFFFALPRNTGKKPTEEPGL